MREGYTKKRKNQHIKLAEGIKIEVGLARLSAIKFRRAIFEEKMVSGNCCYGLEPD